jgi:hypothetical protein
MFSVIWHTIDWLRDRSASRRHMSKLHESIASPVKSYETVSIGFIDTELLRLEISLK